MSSLCCSAKHSSLLLINQRSSGEVAWIKDMMNLSALLYALLLIGKKGNLSQIWMFRTITRVWVVIECNFMWLLAHCEGKTLRMCINDSNETCLACRFFMGWVMFLKQNFSCKRRINDEGIEKETGADIIVLIPRQCQVLPFVCYTNKLGTIQRISVEPR